MNPPLPRTSGAGDPARFEPSRGEGVGVGGGIGIGEDELARGLVIATGADGLTCIALAAPCVDAARIVDAFDGDVVAAWTAGAEVVVGV
ncbi:MAG: hypothetical protein KIT31_35715, partial [Deltaproteobacteria bacterium]|nr:hypothetical protein [Deltaproteobacteria bacterium]